MTTNVAGSSLNQRASVIQGSGMAMACRSGEMGQHKNWPHLDPPAARCGHNRGIPEWAIAVLQALPLEPVGKLNRWVGRHGLLQITPNCHGV